jgi:hypothetical protein
MVMKKSQIRGKFKLLRFELSRLGLEDLHSSLEEALIKKDPKSIKNAISAMSKLEFAVNLFDVDKYCLRTPFEDVLVITFEILPKSILRSSREVTYARAASIKEHLHILDYFLFGNLYQIDKDLKNALQYENDRLREIDEIFHQEYKTYVEHSLAVNN